MQGHISVLCRVQLLAVGRGFRAERYMKRADLGDVALIAGQLSAIRRTVFGTISDPAWSHRSQPTLC